MNGLFIIESIKKIYPSIKGGFVYWETQSNGEPWQNPIDGLIWENQEFPKPSWQQIQQFLPNNPELEIAKEKKLTQLNKNREEFCLIPVEYQGKTYATTLQAWSSITYIISSLSTVSSSADYYTYPQQEKVSLTKADFKVIADKIQTREIASRDKRKILETEINNASSIEELNSIVIEFS